MNKIILEVNGFLFMLKITIQHILIVLVLNLFQEKLKNLLIKYQTYLELKRVIQLYVRVFALVYF